MTIDGMIRKFKSVKVKSLLEESVYKTREQLKRLQRLQMLHGRNRLGYKIGVYKNKAYAIKKHIQNPLAGKGFVDLRLTGEFHKAIFADERETYVVLDSADPKTADLIEMYGEEIFGLNDKYAKEYSAHYLGPQITKQIFAQLKKVR